MTYSSEIAVALKQELGGSHRAVKTVMQWTGASDRTAKHWLSGTNGPSGEHLMALAHYSDHVMQTILRLAGREAVPAGTVDLELRRKLSELFVLLGSRPDLLQKSQESDAH